MRWWALAAAAAVLAVAVAGGLLLAADVDGLLGRGDSKKVGSPRGGWTRSGAWPAPGSVKAYA